MTDKRLDRTMLLLLSARWLHFEYDWWLQRVTFERHSDSNTAQDMEQFVYYNDSIVIRCWLEIAEVGMVAIFEIAPVERAGTIYLLIRKGFRRNNFKRRRAIKVPGEWSLMPMRTNVGDIKQSHLKSQTCLLTRIPWLRLEYIWQHQVGFHETVT